MVTRRILPDEQLTDARAAFNTRASLLCLRRQVHNVMIAPLSWIRQVYFNQNEFGQNIFEDLECNNKYPNLSHLSHANGKYLIWKRGCENK